MSLSLLPPLLLFVLSTFLCESVAVPSVPCSSANEYIYNLSSACFVFTVDPHNAVMAELECQILYSNYDSHLTSIHSLEEETFLYDNIVTFAGHGAWIGLYDSNGGGIDGHMWKDSSPFDYVTSGVFEDVLPASNNYIFASIDEFPYRWREAGEIVTKPGVCRFDLPFCGGVRCDDVESVCSGHGVCVTDEVCVCSDSRFEGDLCGDIVATGCEENGYFCPTGVQPAEVCGRGYFCVNGSRMECGSGFYCPGEVEDSPTDCGYGFWCPNSTMTLPVVCPGGYLCPTTTTSTLTLVACPEGYFCPPGSVSVGPEFLCPEEYGCPIGTDSSTVLQVFMQAKEDERRKKEAWQGAAVSVIVLIVMGGFFFVLLAVISTTIGCCYFKLRSRKPSRPGGSHLTFVFTDVLGSKELHNRVPRGMQAALKMHDALARRLFRMYDAYEIKTLGDAFFVCFAKPLNALQWAADFQLELLRLPWPKSLLEQPNCAEVYVDGTPLDARDDRLLTDGGWFRRRKRSIVFENPDYATSQDASPHRKLIFRGLRVRIGIHFGRRFSTILNRTSGVYDFVGRTVNMASQIEAAAAPGLVFLSPDVHLRLRGFLDMMQFYQCKEAGLFRLKGFSGKHLLRCACPALLRERMAPVVCLSETVTETGLIEELSDEQRVQSIGDENEKHIVVDDTQPLPKLDLSSLPPSSSSPSTPNLEIENSIEGQFPAPGPIFLGDEELEEMHCMELSCDSSSIASVDDDSGSRHGREDGNGFSRRTRPRRCSFVPIQGPQTSWAVQHPGRVHHLRSNSVPPIIEVSEVSPRASVDDLPSSGGLIRVSGGLIFPSIDSSDEDILEVGSTLGRSLFGGDDDFSALSIGSLSSMS